MVFTEGKAPVGYGGLSFLIEGTGFCSTRTGQLWRDSMPHCKIHVLLQMLIPSDLAVKHLTYSLLH